MKLGIPYEKLMEFKTHQDPLAALIDYWLRGNVPKVPVSWSFIVEALTSEYLGEAGLARRISRSYCQLEQDEEGKGQ